MQKNTRVDFRGQEIYVGLDTGKKSWKVCILTEELEHKTFSQPPQPGMLVSYLRRNFPGAKYRCVYEAGYFGFWIHDALRQHGVDCVMTYPADGTKRSCCRRNRGKPQWQTQALADSTAPIETDFSVYPFIESYFAGLGPLGKEATSICCWLLLNALYTPLCGL